eukprot:scaffold259472_cov36-Tisochrysis_lutea.AAC.2
MPREERAGVVGEPLEAAPERLGAAAQRDHREGTVVPSQRSLHLAYLARRDGPELCRKVGDGVFGVPQREARVGQQLLEGLGTHCVSMANVIRQPQPHPDGARQKVAARRSSKFLNLLPHALGVLNATHIAHGAAHVQQGALPSLACAHIWRARPWELGLLRRLDECVHRHHDVLARHIARQLRRDRTYSRVVSVVAPLRAGRIGAPQQPFLEAEVRLGGREA